MGRRGGFLSRAIAKEVGRSIRQSARNSQRAAVQHHRLQVKIAKENVKLSKLHYLAMREQSAAELNSELGRQIDELKNLLSEAFSADYQISFNMLRVKEFYPSLTLPEGLKTLVSPPTLEKYLSAVKQPNWFARLLPGAQKQYEQAITDASNQHAEDLAKHQKEEVRKKERIEFLTLDFEQVKQQALTEIRQRNEDVDALENDYRAGKEDAIITYNTLLLERSEYPEDFPQDFQLFYLPARKQLNLEYELPLVSCIPMIGEYKYVKTRDTIDEKPRKQTEIKTLYADIIASTALRTIYEVFKADHYDHVQTVVFNGYVKGVDPATGKDARPALISVGAPKAVFNSLDLRRVDKQVCLQNFGAIISGCPAEMQGIIPLTTNGNPISQPAQNISSRQISIGRRSVPAKQNVNSTPGDVVLSISDVPRQCLIKIVSQYGPSVSGNARQCRALLLDLCGEHRREIHVLISVIEENIADELTRTDQTMPPAVLIARLAKKLHDNLGTAEILAQWAVESWALALGIISIKVK